MRGKQNIMSDIIFNVRITPAHAGKTAVAKTSEESYGDHPRACGENKVGFYKSPFEQGSPPRMRGKQRRLANVLNVSRITPAHAGKTV